MALDTGDVAPAFCPRDADLDPEGTQDAFGENLENLEVVEWKVVYTAQAQKDAKRIVRAGLKSKAEALLGILQKNPFQSPPPYEKLVGDLDGAYSRRITIQHRLVYQVLKRVRTVKVIRLWTHYE